LILGLGLALLLERFDRRLWGRDELEDSFGLPVLGAIPDSKAFGDRRSGMLPPLESEAFRMLRARLRYFEVDGRVTSVLVTSGAAKDGKSTVAWNLALTAASVGSKTILLECDFHQPTLATRRGLRRVPGLSELVMGKTDLVVQHVPVANSSNGQDPGRQLDVVVAGTRPANPLELMESAEMAALLEHLGSEYDLVVMDTPPITLVSDVIPLLRLVSGVIVVGEPGRTKRGSAAAVREQLDSLGAPVLGVVANRVKHSGDFYAYYHDDELASLRIGERA
jgi:capsular exopolysaccharide synthesis family protein